LIPVGVHNEMAIVAKMIKGPIIVADAKMIGRITVPVFSGQDIVAFVQPGWRGCIPFVPDVTPCHRLAQILFAG
jgi:hypothetical protein